MVVGYALTNILDEFTPDLKVLANKFYGKTQKENSVQRWKQSRRVNEF
jgi:hypothetical protein